MSAGKGSRPRPVRGDTFRSNYDRIFDRDRKAETLVPDASEECWLCEDDRCDCYAEVNRVSPGGAECPTRRVPVHFSCWQDMDP